MSKATLFVSYSHLDWKDWVEPLVEAIQVAGHVVAVADSAMRAGDPIPEWIRERVSQADLALLCWSPAAAQSAWVQAERRLLAAQLKRVVWAERKTAQEEILRRIAAPAGPLLLAAPADANRGQALFQALDLTPTPITAADTPLPVLRDAVNSGRPLIVLWSQAAAQDRVLGNFLDQVLMQDLSAGRRRLYLHALDDTPIDALHAAIRGATFSDLEALGGWCFLPFCKATSSRIIPPHVPR
ncbi:MAG TPA: toll/interleukin-1 receptor domain-containing protein [Polyangia bacterium]|nr:toll/interleukin-1 receptor domain-containing protein [Polyangia bacterium]